MQTIKDSRTCPIKNFQTAQTAFKTSVLKLPLLVDFSASVET